jgi:hypothetical protein
MLIISIIFTAIGWIMYQTTSHFGNLANLSPIDRPPIFRNESMVGLVNILNTLSVIIFIIASLSLYFSGFPSPIFWWIIIIMSANIIGEALMALFFYRQSIILVSSILAPLSAIGLVLPFWLMAQIHISWIYKILIMIPAFGVYFILILPSITALITLLTIPITFLLYPLILIEKRMRGIGDNYR